MNNLDEAVGENPRELIVYGGSGKAARNWDCYRAIVRNVETILAIELLAASQAVDFLKPLKPGVGGRAAHRLVRSVSPPLKKDRALAKDIEAVMRLVAEGNFANILATAERSETQLRSRPARASRVRRASANLHR